YFNSFTFLRNIAINIFKIVHWKSWRFTKKAERGIFISEQTSFCPLIFTSCLSASLRTLSSRLLPLMFHLRLMSKISMMNRSEEHTSELQSRFDLVCR